MRATSFLISSLLLVATLSCGPKAAPATTPTPPPGDGAETGGTEGGTEGGVEGGVQGGVPDETKPPEETPTPPAAGNGMNLKVMPATLTKDQVVEIMKTGIAPALGVKCEFCHDLNDFAADTNPHKERAREMMRMTQDIAAKNFNGEYKVTCVTCHNGKEKPRTE